MFLIIGRRLLLLAAVSATMLLTSPAQASRVTPMIVDIEPTGRGSVARIELTNDADFDLAYEVQIMRGEISPQGELSLTPAEEEFIVFPPQAMVEANSQQVFRIQYVGEQALETSQIYYLSIKQIPVEFEPGQNQVQVVINYNVLVNVVPDGTEPVATIRRAEYVERQVSMEGVAQDDIPAVIPIEKGIEVELANDGSRYFYAGRSNWAISARTTEGEDFTLDFDGEQISRIIGTGVVGPDRSRIFFLPTEKALVPGTLGVTVTP